MHIKNIGIQKHETKTMVSLKIFSSSVRSFQGPIYPKDYKFTQDLR